MGVLLAVVAACGGDEGVSISADKDNFCSEIAEVACHNLYQCCTEGEIEDFLEVSEPRTEAQCRDDLAKSCERRAGTLNDSINAGRVAFNSDRMNACLNAIVAPAESCATVVAELPWEDACVDTAWVGTVGTGGACFFAHDCAGSPDSFCGPNQKCAARPIAGFPCGTGCASDFYCGTNGICAAKVPAGAPCQSASQCDDDLFCDFEALPAPVCTARLPGGEACTSSNNCESGSCIPGQCMGTGGTCFNDLQCDSRCADDGSFCSTSAQCASGTCSVGGNLCSDESQCAATVDDTCVFPVLCLPGDCIGDPVCTAETITVDYCTGALSQLPLF
jgi:hypothetical protein